MSYQETIAAFDLLITSIRDTVRKKNQEIAIELDAGAYENAKRMISFAERASEIMVGVEKLKQEWRSLFEISPQTPESLAVVPRENTFLKKNT